MLICATKRNGVNHGRGSRRDSIRAERRRLLSGESGTSEGVGGGGVQVKNVNKQSTVSTDKWRSPHVFFYFHPRAEEQVVLFQSSSMTHAHRWRDRRGGVDKWKGGGEERRKLTGTSLQYQRVGHCQRGVRTGSRGEHGERGIKSTVEEADRREEEV